VTETETAPPVPSPAAVAAHAARSRPPAAVRAARAAHAAKEKRRADVIAKDIRWGVPVVGFTGVNGAGKTTLGAESAIADMARGRDVYSTVPIHSEFGDSKPILSLAQLLTLRHATLFLDDVAVIFSSRSTGSLPPEVVALLQMLRHADLTVIWTAPNWMRCDNQIRDITQACVTVSPLRIRMPFAPRARTPWPAPQWVAAALMDTSDIKPDAEPVRTLRRRLVRPQRLASWGAFDTHADAPQIGGRAQAGTCADCGGTIFREKHSESRHASLGLPWYG